MFSDGVNYTNLGDFVTWSSVSATLGAVNWTQFHRSSTQSPSPIVRATTSNIVKLILCMISFTCNVAGNGLTLTAIRKTPKLRTKADIILCSLTMADLFVAIDIVYYSVYMAIDRAFLNPCNFAVPMTIFTAFAKAPAYVSSLHLTVAAVDRYVAVVHPFAYQDRLTDGVVRAMLAAVWIVGCLLGASNWMWLINRKRRPICQIVSPAYSWLEVALFITTVTLVAAMYGRILKIAWNHHIRLNSELTVVFKFASAASTTTSDQQGHQQNEHQCTQSQQQQPEQRQSQAADDGEHKQAKVRRKEFKAVYLTTAVVSAYAVLWCPYIIGRGLEAAGRSESYVASCINIGNGFGIFNSCFNWLLYGAVSKKYRQAYWRLLRGCP
jgi:hypothetical protein